jgi:hypothetical protein
MDEGLTEGLALEVSSNSLKDYVGCVWWSTSRNVLSNFVHIGRIV